MLDRFRGAQALVLRPLARALLRLGVPVDAVTWVGAIGVTVVCLICFPQGWLWQGAVLATVLSVSDMIDGHMARESGSTSPWGSFLDSTLDRMADAGILGGLAWWLGLSQGPLWAVLMIWALVAAQLTSYVKARAEAVGASADVGVMTRADRVAVALIGAGLAGVGVPGALQVAVILLVVGGSVTVVQRMVAVHRQGRAEAIASTRPGKN